MHTSQPISVYLLIQFAKDACIEAEYEFQNGIFLIWWANRMKTTEISVKRIRLTLSHSTQQVIQSLSTNNLVFSLKITLDTLTYLLAFNIHSFLFVSTKKFFFFSSENKLIILKFRVRVNIGDKTKRVFFCSSVSLYTCIFPTCSSIYYHSVSNCLKFPKMVMYFAYQIDMNDSQAKRSNTTTSNKFHLNNHLYTIYK